MFGSRQQWNRMGHKCELCWPVAESVLMKWAALHRSQQGPCDLMLRGQAPHWDILPLQSPQRLFWTLVEWSRGRGARGKQVQSTGGVIPTAICFPFRCPGSLNGLWHASWRHVTLASRTVPRHHGTMIWINPCTCAESTSFVSDHGREKEEMESCIDKCVKGHLPLIHFC